MQSFRVVFLEVFGNVILEIYAESMSRHLFLYGPVEPFKMSVFVGRANVYVSMYHIASFDEAIETKTELRSVVSLNTGDLERKILTHAYPV